MSDRGRTLERVPLAQAERRALADELVDAKSTVAILQTAALLRNR